MAKIIEAITTNPKLLEGLRMRLRLLGFAEKTLQDVAEGDEISSIAVNDERLAPLAELMLDLREKDVFAFDVADKVELIVNIGLDEETDTLYFYFIDQFGHEIDRKSLSVSEVLDAIQQGRPEYAYAFMERLAGPYTPILDCLDRDLPEDEFVFFGDDEGVKSLEVWVSCALIPILTPRVYPDAHFGPSGPPVGLS